MEYNPYTQEYNRLKLILETKNSERRRLSNELDWFNSTNISSLQYFLAGKEQDRIKTRSIIDDIEKEIEALQNKIQATNSRIKTLFNPLNWFDSVQKNYRGTLNKLKKETNSKKENMKKREVFLSEINESINKYKKEIDKYEGFDKIKIESKIKSLSQEIASLEVEISKVCGLKMNVDTKLKPILSQIEDYNFKISQAKEVINKAKSFERDLDYADNSYERAMVHEECESVLGDGSPKKIIIQQERIIRRFERDLDKVKKRAMQIGKKASRVIKNIVIDGNNMCYEGNKFVGLLPLIKSTYTLQEKYKIIVVFDSAIRSQLHADDKAIKANFGRNVSIHIVANKQLADETILDIASGDEYCYVISNDRFGEYKEKEVVRNNRLIRHEIVDGKIFIHELDVNEKYG